MAEARPAPAAQLSRLLPDTMADLRATGAFLRALKEIERQQEQAERNE